MKIPGSKSNQQAKRLGKIVKIENSKDLNNSLDAFKLRTLEMMTRKGIKPSGNIFTK